MIELSEDHGDRSVEWAEANAANYDGHATIEGELEAEKLYLEQMGAATRQWLQTLGDARNAVTKAQRQQRSLADLDYDFSESSVGRGATRSLNDAWRALDSAMIIARGVLGPIADAEKDAEISRLRAEVGQLQRRLADRGRPAVPIGHYCDTGNCEVCGDGTGDVLPAADPVDGEGSGLD